jgi:hypothetical protein
MQTTRIDTLKLGDAAIETLKAAFLYDDATLADGTADDIAGLPAGLKIQLRKLFPNLSTVTVAAPAPVVTAKPNSLLENLDDRPQAIELVLKRIASGDKSPDLRRVARKLGIESVARLDGKVSIETTISYLSHLDDGGSVRTSWKDHEIVSIDELSAKLRISPTDDTELEDGVDPRTGIDWSAMPDDVIAMIRFAAKDNMVRGMSDKAIAAAFGGEDPDLIKRVQRRMKTAKVDAEGLLRDLRKVPITSAKPLGDDALRQMIVNASAKLVQSYDKASIRFMLGDYPDLSPRAVSNMSDRCAEIARSMNFIVQVDNYRDGGSSVLTLRRNV